jgi:hypothetical protein
MACISLAYVHETFYRFAIVPSDELLAIESLFLRGRIEGMREAVVDMLRTYQGH